MHLGLVSASQATQLTEVFVSAIMAIDQALYSEQQKLTWITGADNVERWRHYLQRNVVMGVWQQDQLLGFVSYQAYRCYVDMLFVRPNWQGKGIATKLYLGALNYHYPPPNAQSNSQPMTQAITQPRIFTHASAAASPFFTTHGFITLAQRQVVRNHCRLTQYWMMKPATNRAT